MALPKSEGRPETDCVPAVTVTRELDRLNGQVCIPHTIPYVWLIQFLTSERCASLNLSERTASWIALKSTYSLPRRSLARLLRCLLASMNSRLRRFRFTSRKPELPSRLGTTDDAAQCQSLERSLGSRSPVRKRCARSARRTLPRDPSSAAPRTRAVRQGHAECP